MKKTKFLVLFIIAALLLPILAACTPQNPTGKVLRIYNWADYIDPDLITAFEEQYGATVIYDEFDTNEIMYTQLTDAKEEYDLVCPSDYMIQKLIEADVLQAIDETKAATYYANVSPFIEEKFNPIISNDGDKYAVGYMWGLMGILYNQTNVAAKNKTDAEINSWNILFDTDFKNQVYMKDSIRDTFAALSIYAYQNEIASGTSVQNILSKKDDDLLARLKDAMLKQKEAVKPKFEVDKAKNTMAKSNKNSLALMWSGDAYTSIWDAEDNDIDLAFALPTEGNNVFMDGLAIPKNHKADEQLIYDFINFISDPANAVQNMSYIGYTSVIAGQGTDGSNPIYKYMVGEDTEHEYLNKQRGSQNVAYFFFGDNDTYNVVGELYGISEIMYPEYDYINTRCAIMYDYGDYTQKFNDLWLETRGTDFPGWAIALIIVGVLLIAAAFFIIKYKKQILAFIGKKFPNLVKSKDAKTAPAQSANTAAAPEKPTEPKDTQPSEPTKQQLPDDDDDEFIPPDKK
ncbi:MAG: extracellular solute-binding protein [Clostridiales bacterium]|jgi:spermidine/putrescine transport system substrate-binding protein|nr:extracellular solute-binding protein [Clostridiales bacterium]